jgi:flagellar export protein FliJ
VARFRYVLQPALDVALAREREALGELRRAQQRSVRRCAALEDVSSRERELRARTSALVRDVRSAAALLDAEACFGALAIERRGRLASLARADDAVAAARIVFARNAERRTSLERHRANAHSAWQAHEELREAQELDEANALAQAHHLPERTYVA